MHRRSLHLLVMHYRSQRHLAQFLTDERPIEATGSAWEREYQQCQWGCGVLSGHPTLDPVKLLCSVYMSSLYQRLVKAATNDSK